MVRKPADARDADLAQARGNVTNLALKGIIAIQAMSEISRIMDEAEDAQKYEVRPSFTRLMKSYSYTVRLRRLPKASCSPGSASQQPHPANLDGHMMMTRHGA